MSQSDSDRRPRLGKWVTVTGPHAFCDGCPWHMHGDNDAKRLMSAARFHVRDTGHVIQIQRGQSTEMR
jgi:hypothetical protein